MSAKCFGCEVGAGTIAGAMFTLGEPVGSCRWCNALMCGKHGDRDPGPPRFECVLCAPGLLAASAASASGIGANETEDERAALAELARFGSRGEGRGTNEQPPQGYRSLEDFVRCHPRYGKGLLQALRATHWRVIPIEPDDSPARRAAHGMSPTALALLGGAKVLVERLKIPDSELSPTLRDALGALVRDDGRAAGRFP